MWTREIARREIRKFETCPTLCILTDSTPGVDGIITGLFAFDFDDQQSYEYMRKKFPVIDAAPLVKTTHGYHVYFLRSQLCEDLNITDGARALKIHLPEDEGLPSDEKHKLTIDIKTRTSVLNLDGSYTASVLSVPPSKGKVWLRPFPETPLFQLPAVLADWIHARRVNGKRARVDHGSVPASKARTVLQDARDRIQPNISSLRGIGFQQPVQTQIFDSVSEMSQHHGYCCGAQFIDPAVQSGGPCPLCLKSDGHKSNNYSLLIKTDGSRFVKNLSGACTGRYVQIPWDADSEHAHFDLWLQAETRGVEKEQLRNYDVYKLEDHGILVRNYEAFHIGKSGEGWYSKQPWNPAMRKPFFASSDVINILFD
jgi:hypothetical protein